VKDTGIPTFKCSQCLIWISHVGNYWTGLQPCPTGLAPRLSRAPDGGWCSGRVCLVPPFHAALARRPSRRGPTGRGRGGGGPGPHARGGVGRRWGHHGGCWPGSVAEHIARASERPRALVRTRHVRPFSAAASPASPKGLPRPRAYGLALLLPGVYARDGLT